MSLAMKTIIIYATKHGAAGEIARRISEKIGNAVIHDLKQGATPPLADFDCVIIGSPVYAGMIRKEAKVFLSQNASTLQGKCLGLFLSGLDARSEETFFRSNFPADILQSAKAAMFLGGIFDPQKTGWLECFIIKVATKQSAYSNTIDDAKIEQFAEAMRG
jgi:menaquinone-dependent protoporphyrinogen oxidase